MAGERKEEKVAKAEGNEDTRSVTMKIQRMNRKRMKTA
jgi:hypothetical protein